MNHTRRLFTTSVALLGMSAFISGAGAADKGNGKGKGKAHHQNGKQLLGDKLKTNGKHELHKKGPHTATVEVKDGKIVGVTVKHAKNGAVAVTKYKTSKKLAHTDGLQLASLQLAQVQNLGTVYIGYAYVDEYGDEEIYWFPYDMIYDGDTGAVEYVPVY